MRNPGTADGAATVTCGFVVTLRWSGVLGAD
jgi:hypothetical protein